MLGQNKVAVLLGGSCVAFLGLVVLPIDVAVAGRCEALVERFNAETATLRALNAQYAQYSGNDDVICSPGATSARHRVVSQMRKILQIGNEAVPCEEGNRYNYYIGGSKAAEGEDGINKYAQVDQICAQEGYFSPHQSDGFVRRSARRVKSAVNKFAKAGLRATQKLQELDNGTSGDACLNQTYPYAGNATMCEIDKKTDGIIPNQ